MIITQSTCCYCGVGCGVLIATDGQRILDVQGDPDHPANHGRLCTKGSTLHLSAQNTDARALSPSLRKQRDEPRTQTSWNEALDHTADRFADIIRQHGPDAVAFYISGQMLTEDYYVFNKLAKGLIQTNNVDSNSRLCMSSAVAGYKLTLGADSVPTCYDDIDEADVIFIIGSNMAWAHPILYRRIEAAREKNPELKLVVIDPRRTDTAAMADLHLAVMPGTDVALFNSMLHTLVWDDLLDDDYVAAHTAGFSELKKHVREYAPGNIAPVCGLSSQDIERAARLFGEKGKKVLSFYCMGLNQSAQGSDKNAALINLHLATGKIGKPGCGPFSLTGQPNAMGGREVGGMANLLSAHRDLGNAGHRAEIAALWGVDAVPATPGKTAVELFEAINNGQIKAVWIACTNPVHSMPNQSLIEQALQKAELVVVQEAFSNTDTVPYADVLLPATTWAEKEGTVTNSERRISHVRAAIAAPGEARHDWAIATDFAQRLAQRLNKPASLFAYDNPEAVFNEHRQTTAGRDLDITGLSYALLDEKGPQQWPLPAGQLIGRARLYEDGVFATDDGRARFHIASFVPVAEDTDARYPFRLISGRLRDQWHGMSRTGRVSRLYAHADEPLLDMHASDMARLSLRDDDIVELRSRRGRITVKVKASASIKRGQVFLPMHWSRQLMNSAGVNALTLDTIDARSYQPELKHAAVRIEKLSLPWRLLVLAEGNALQMRERLSPLLSHFDHATLTQFGRDQDHVALAAWHGGAVADEVLTAIDQIVQLDDSSRVAAYSDARRGISKKALICDGHLQAIRLTGEVAASQWLRELMQEQRTIENLRPWLFSPLATPPVDTGSRGRIVCACMNVSENEIRDAIGKGCDLNGLRLQLKCGTGCGSCVPELRLLLQEAALS